MFIKEKRYNDRAKKVYVEVYVDDVPETFPENGGDLDGEGGTRDDYTFESGSIIYVVGSSSANAGRLFMARSDGTWIEQ